MSRIIKWWTKAFAYSHINTMTAENPWVSQNKKQTKKKPTHTLLEMSMHYLGKDMRLFSTQHSLFLFSMDHVKKASGRPEFSTLTSRVTNYMDVMKMASLETKWGPTHVYIQAQPFSLRTQITSKKNICMVDLTTVNRDINTEKWRWAC